MYKKILLCYLKSNFIIRCIDEYIKPKPTPLSSSPSNSPSCSLESLRKRGQSSGRMVRKAGTSSLIYPLVLSSTWPCSFSLASLPPLLASLPFLPSPPSPPCLVTFPSLPACLPTFPSLPSAPPLFPSSARMRMWLSFDSREIFWRNARLFPSAKCVKAAEGERKQSGITGYWV